MHVVVIKIVEHAYGQKKIQEEREKREKQNKKRKQNNNCNIISFQHERNLGSSQNQGPDPLTYTREVIARGQLLANLPPMGKRESHWMLTGWWDLHFQR